MSIVVAFAGGDLAMAGVATGAQLLVPTIAGQWLASAAVDALGAYLLFGLPQIRSWEADKRPTPSTDDFRTRWSLALLREDRWLKFVLASLIGGPLAVGLASGYSSHANGRRRTLISAVILGVVWSAFYLGLVSRIVG